MTILDIENITKNYGSIRALQSVSLTIEAGQIFGLLGPNGSGKTTMLGIITGIIKTTEGKYRWNLSGKGFHNLKLGVILETPNFYPYMNAEQNLQLVCAIKQYPTEKIDSLLELVKLKERKHSRFSSYSLGMRQRLAIAAAMIGDPEVLIFDEPTNGLDPEGIAEIRSIIQRIAKSGKTVILASHILNEVEKVCTHVGIIKSGKVLATGPVGQILGNKDVLEISSTDNVNLLKLLHEHQFTDINTRDDGIIELLVETNTSSIEISKVLYEGEVLITHFVRKRRSLEDEFLEITKNN